jgi:bifunctional non-homologous end joining protein LigD
LVRCPDGIGGETFYQKHPGFWTPPQVRRLSVPGETEEYLYVDSVPGLVALAQVGILEIHPWNSRVARLEQPDQVILDLDPDMALPFSRVAAAARRVRALLTERGLESFVKTTGGKGLHVVAPIAPGPSWEEAAEFSRAVAESTVRANPRRYVARMAKSERRGKIFIDYLRNVRGATSVAAYSTRAKPEATVSVPLAWDELSARITSGHFTLANLRTRLDGLKADPWAAYWKTRQRLPEP